ncbi:MAG: hypothetical protein JNL01_12910 [Bdellovibrionales bacterium]|nr:hypothetical protein [Bdellovibrionales bacterium]
MSSNRLGFRPFRNALEKAPKDTTLVVDSNIIIAYFDEAHSLHEKVVEFLDDLDEIANITLYTTVTTKSEFLEYHRRRLLTEALVSIADGEVDVPISESSRAKIYTIKGRRNLRESQEEKRAAETGDLDFDINVSYFNDKEIKDIKKAFRARDIPNETGWLKICEVYLKSKLVELETEIDSFCTYLSPHKESQKSLFVKPDVEWTEATRLCGTTGTGYSDALILNMLLHTNINYLVSMDFDLVYAAAVDAKNKTVILPDNRIAAFKHTLKGIT